jgi:DNA/RNA-binding domain of Phe-tRNA-synthetase-like protein
MRVRCEEELFEKFPRASIHGVVFDRLDMLEGGADRVWKGRTLESVRESGISPELLVEVPEIKAWRNAFQSFGLKPSKYRSSIEQLYRRALKGDLIETRLPLVNLYCYVSILHRAPMGAYDLEKTRGDICVRPARGGEEFMAIGEKQVAQCEAGVIVYADAEGIICWGWNHRDSARTCLGLDTRRAIFFADSSDTVTRRAAEEAINTLTAALVSSGCVKLPSFALDRERCETELPI